MPLAPSGNDLQIPLANGNIMKIQIASINITEEVNKTGIWKQVNNGSGNGLNNKGENPWQECESLFVHEKTVFLF